MPYRYDPRKKYFEALVPPTLAYGVERVKGVKQEGVRASNWLAKEEAEKLINIPVYRWQCDATGHL